MAKKKKKTSGPNWLKLGLELVVVFVGVTAGFLLNNFREDSVNQELESVYLKNLMVNLEADSMEIKGHIQANGNNVDVSRQAVNSFQNNNITLDQAMEVLSVIVTYNDISLQDATYQSIVGSGNLGLIRNIELRNSLIAYYQFLDQVRNVEQVHNEYITTYVLPFVMKNMDMTLGEIRDNFELKGIEFRNLTAGYYVVESQKMEMSIKLDSLNVQLRKQLAAEIYHKI